MNKLCTETDLASLDPAKTAHLAIDVQEDYFSERSKYLIGNCRHEGQGVAQRIARVAPQFNKAGLAATLWIYHRAVNEKLYLVEPEPQDLMVSKRNFSAFSHTQVDAALKARSVDTLLVSGGYTTICVRASVLDAVDHGYRVFVLTDCIQNYERTHKSLSEIFTKEAGPAPEPAKALLTTSAKVLERLSAPACRPV